MSQIVLASNNAGKLRELQHILKGIDIELLPQSAFNMPEAEETGQTFIENAIIKARHASQHSGLPALADDSGLEVDALGGAPGVYSSRFAGSGCTDQDNVEKLLSDLQGVAEEQRSARFRCLIVFMRNAQDPTPLIGQGSWEGRIATEQIGDNGFGYDPVFYIPELGCSAAELSAEHKNQVSHRTEALQKFAEAWNQAGYVL